MQYSDRQLFSWRFWYKSSLSFATVTSCSGVKQHKGCFISTVQAPPYAWCLYAEEPFSGPLGRIKFPLGKTSSFANTHSPSICSYFSFYLSTDHAMVSLLVPVTLCKRYVGQHLIFFCPIFFISVLTRRNSPNCRTCCLDPSYLFTNMITTIAAPPVDAFLWHQEVPVTQFSRMPLCDVLGFSRFRALMDYKIWYGHTCN